MIIFSIILSALLLVNILLLKFSVNKLPDKEESYAKKQLLSGDRFEKDSVNNIPKYRKAV